MEFDNILKIAWFKFFSIMFILISWNYFFNSFLIHYTYIQTQTIKQLTLKIEAITFKSYIHKEKPSHLPSSFCYPLQILSPFFPLLSFSSYVEISVNRRNSAVSLYIIQHCHFCSYFSYWLFLTAINLSVLWISLTLFRQNIISGDLFTF